jgi:sugar fermentation stimulation protein A
MLQNLVKRDATIIKRYKRFLADIKFNDGTIETIYVPNTGSMKTCWGPGWKVRYSESDNKKRKLPLTLEMLYNEQTWIGINTSLTNKLAAEALKLGVIQEIPTWDKLESEVKLGKSRIDFVAKRSNGPDTFIEVKNVTLLASKGKVSFPDAVSTRGQKHLELLIDLAQNGQQSVLLFIIQREDAHTFLAHQEFDPAYADLLRLANEKGVQILPYICEVNPESIQVKKKIPIDWSR